jgi:uncharacterized membrane-anchored protein
MASGRHQQDVPRYQRALRTGVVKVPEVTIYFWIVKLLTTAMGEAISDFLVNDWNKYLGVLLGFVVFAIAIFFQFRSKAYSTWLYWLAVSMVAVFGTQCADVLHVVLHLPYTVSFTLYAVLLAATFITWYRSERTLDIHTISTRRREVFYWLTVIFTFAMGTAVGDLTATTFHLGYLASAFMFLGALALPLIAWRLGANPVATFWVAYVLTRPAGASFADYFGMPKDISGAGLGHGPVSVVLIILVAAGVWFLKSSGKDEQQPSGLPAQPGYAAQPTANGYPQDGGYPAQGGHAQQDDYGRGGYDPRNR